MAEPKLNPQIRATALAQVKRRLSIHFNWLDTPDNDERVLRIFRRAMFLARYYYRLHKWDNLPLEEKAPADDEIADAIEWQNYSTLVMIESEHKMTLVSCFMAIGIERTTADAIVEHIITKDKLAEETE